MKPARSWQMQEAKNKLSEVVDAAIESGAQTITRRGLAVAVVLSMEEYKQKHKPEKRLIDILREAPWKGSNLKIERSQKLTRDIAL